MKRTTAGRIQFPDVTVLGWFQPGTALLNTEQVSVTMVQWTVMSGMGQFSVQVIRHLLFN